MSADEIRAAAETHRELPPEYQNAVIESFMAKVDREIDARVDARLASHGRMPGLRRPRSAAFFVLTTLVMAIPLSAIAAAAGAHPAGFWGLLVVQATAQTVLTLYTGVISTILSEMFPTNVRYTALSVSYGFAVAIFGGFAPYIATFLVHVTGNPLAPSFYVMAAALASGIAVLFVHERFRAPALA